MQFYSTCSSDFIYLRQPKCLYFLLSFVGSNCGSIRESFRFKDEDNYDDEIIFNFKFFHVK